VQAAEAEVRESLDGFGGRLEIAAVNGPAAVVVSGDADAIEEWLPRWPDRKTKRLRVSHAFHSPRMEPMLAEFRAVAASLAFGEPRIAVVSNLTGEVVSSELTDPDYWAEHVRRPVRFADGMRTLRREGVIRFLELGPDAVLTAVAPQALGPDDDRTLFAAALRASGPEAAEFTGFLARVHATGVTVDWRAFYQGSGALRVGLPTYAFQRERYWLRSAATPGEEVQA
jgi:acyl transferase domain-containing protein